MQNGDGGFAAFGKGNGDWFLMRWLAGDFDNSAAQVFDESSADVTAHVLEAWAVSGFCASDRPVERAMGFLKQKQTKFGAWQGRWGVNYIYGVSAVVPAIAKISGVDLLQMKLVLKSID